MKKLQRILSFAFVALLAVAVVQAQEGVLVLRADLSGAEEVPPHPSDASGTAKFKVNQARTAIEFTLDLKNGTDILGVAGAHLHCAPAGLNGPVVVFLAGSLPGGFDGDVQIRGTLNQGNIVGPACGATLAELVDSMRAGNVYVNVHSVANPGGEIRGQVRE